MIQIIGCKNCGNESLGLDRWYVNVDYKLNHYCEHCRNTEPETKSEHFCCIKCFKEYYKIEKE